MRHGQTAIETQHEGNILEEQPTWPSLPAREELEESVHKAGSLASYAGCPSTLAQVLAREPRRDQVDIGEPVSRVCNQSVDVLAKFRIDEPPLEYSPSLREPLAKEASLESGVLQSELDATDAGE